MNAAQAQLAARLTLLAVYDHAWVEHPEPSISREHCESMVQRMLTFRVGADDAKANRWLGWLQAAVVTSTSLTLDRVKQINKEVLAELTNDPDDAMLDRWLEEGGSF